MQRRLTQRVGAICHRAFRTQNKFSNKSNHVTTVFQQFHVNRCIFYSIRHFSENNNNNATHSDFQTQWKTADTDDIKKQIEKDVKDNHVFLYMKGTPLMPQCGFSKNVVAMLQYLNVGFSSRDVLSHPALRPAIKEYSNWPTFPQLYVNGELVGGHDIVMDMFKNGELETLLAKEEETGQDGKNHENEDPKGEDNKQG